jgi:hypothetical protein
MSWHSKYNQAWLPWTSIWVLKEGTSENRRWVKEPEFCQNARRAAVPV